jgi:PAS domain S-box-containing protein
MAPGEGQLSAAVFADGGEMGALMRSLDWSKTPLGPVATWSQTLRATVGLLLRNRFPLILWWGPQFIQLYNDAYRPIPGAKHPKSMGQPANECWSEIWHIIGPMIEAPFLGEPASWSDDLSLFINRQGFFEETHFKVAYSPVPDDTVQSTRVGGVLATVAETTEQVQGERQLRTLRELGARSANAKTQEEACQSAISTLAENAFDVPFALIYLLDPAATRARLAGSSGFRFDGSAANPQTIDLQNRSEATWPVARIAQTKMIEVLTDLSRLGTLPCGLGSQAPHSAIAMPLFSPDQPHPYGVLIAGCSPHRALDQSYRTFFELAASQVITAIRNALALEDQRRRAEKLAELDRAKTAFFSNVSHEFRTPLTLMLGPLQDMLVKPDGAMRAEDREALTVVHRNGLRLQKLVNTLLDFSRIEAGRIQASYEATALEDYTADLASSFRSSCERAGLTLTVDCPPLPEPVYVDREMWEKILLNLLSNAFKHTFEGGISVRLQARDRAVVLSVSDTGVGIPEADLPRIFERFYRVRGTRARTYEGTGIGLSLIQELVGLHRGTIQVSSRPGAGSTFTVEIPRGFAHLPADRIGAERTQSSTATQASTFANELLGSDGEPSSKTSAPSAVSDRPREKVLLADDNADMRAYLFHLLAKRWDVMAVENGSEALQAAREQAPDLVLADVMMPMLDGFGLLRELRADQRTATIPVILVSARAGEEARAEDMRHAADDYLVKPFSAPELLARVQAHLELARVRREARLREEELRERLQLQFDRMPIACMISDPTIRIIDWNPAAEQIFGYRREEVLGKDGFQLLVAPTSRPEVEKINRGLAAGDIAAHGIAENVTKDGRIILCQWHETPLLNARGEVIAIMAMAQDITARVHAEEQLRQSRALLSAAEQIARLGSWSWDLRTDAVAWSDEHYRLLGFDPARGGATFKDGYQRIHPEDRAAVNACIEAALGGNAPEECRWRAVLPDGTLRFFYSRLQVERDPEGIPRRMFGSMLDVTESKRVEDALRDSEQGLERELAGMARLQDVSTRVLVQAGDSTPLLQEIVDAAITITSADMGNIQLFDQEKRQLRIVASRGFGRPFLEFFDGVQHGEAASGTAMLKGERVVVEDVTVSPIFAGTPGLELMLAAGARAVQSTPLVNRAGRLMGMLSTHYRSPRTFAERDLHVVDLLARQAADWIERGHAETQLRSSEEWIRRLVSLMPAAVYTCDSDGRITFFNRRAAELWGREPEVGDPTRSEWFSGSFRTWTPDGKLVARSESPMAAAVREGCSFRDLELVFEQPLGGRVIVNANIEPRFDAQGHRDGAINVFEDITARKQAQVERERLLESERQARGEAERLARLKDNFLATVSHELRTPLSAIVGWTDLIRRQIADPGRVMHGMDVIARNARTQERLISDLLDLSRVVTGKMRLKVEPVELPLVIEAAVEAVKPAVDARGIRLHCVTEPITQRVNGDAARLQQIFWNLLSNAVKFTPEGGRVEVVLARVNSHVEISVSDTGKGIPADFLPRIFERFRQADVSAVREHGGLGIGLALVKELTQLHGGKVSVASEGTDKGSTFTVELPLAIQRAGQDEVRQHPSVPAHLSIAELNLPLLDGVRVLVLDDEPDALEVIQAILEDRHATVTPSRSVESALATLEHERFDVVISDIGMPNRDGYEFILEARKLGVTTPAAAVTAFARSEDRVRALSAGFQAHLAKPIEVPELLATVASLSGRIRH